MPKRIDYDPTVLHSLAASLYSQAAGIVISYAVFAFLVGGGIGIVASYTVPMGGAGGGSGVALVLGFFSALIGAALGQSRASALRVQAQTLLCQVQIEQHLQHLVEKQG